MKIVLVLRKNEGMETKMDFPIDQLTDFQVGTLIRFSTNYYKVSFVFPDIKMAEDQGIIEQYVIVADLTKDAPM